jgi:flagellar biosynthesis protein FlhB
MDILEILLTITLMIILILVIDYAISRHAYRNSKEYRDFVKEYRRMNKKR